MVHFAGLDVSVKATSVCVVDDAGKVILEQKAPTEPADIIAVLTSLGVRLGRIGIEAGPLSQWLVNGLLAADLPVICVETRHMKALLTAQQISKTDRNDARGIAQMMRVGLFKPVHVKTLVAFAKPLRDSFGGRDQDRVEPHLDMAKRHLMPRDDATQVDRGDANRISEQKLNLDPGKFPSMDRLAHLRDLNVAQRAAVEYSVSNGTGADGSGPLLVIAGAGTGKTSTLAHRVAHLVVTGTLPERILLLTFTRRAAAEMTKRAQHILSTAWSPAKPGAFSPAGEIAWSGTFHAIGNRLLREYADSIGLDPSFTVLDRTDAADRLNLVRNDLALAKTEARFPRKDTCLAIYSHTVNACCPLTDALESAFPWCAEWEGELKKLFRGYVEAKQRDNVLDYDDLLLYWAHMMDEPALARLVGEQFDHVLVDEYQDTNALQAQIVLRMKPDGHGLTVVGDGAQSIYSFRAATVRNILDFPKQFTPPAHVVTLEQNYRSTQPILEACNAVIGLATEGFRRQLFSATPLGERPWLVTAADEAAQVEYVVERVLEHREAGIDLKRQAVLFRAGHHSDQLEVELARRNIPFVKYGGLKFLETAHVKDVLSVLRWVENPRDAIAAFRGNYALD